MQASEGSTRTWLGPLTGLAFAIIGISGILMFFHVRLPGMTMLHELGGLLFVAAAVWHVKLNWKPLLRCCSQRKGLAGLLIGAALMVLFAGFGIGHDKEHRGRRGGPPCSEVEPHGPSGE